MSLRPHKAYFLVKINKEQQKKRLEQTDSGIFLAMNYVFMTRCMQNAEIVDIGEFAHKAFPEAKIGDTLIIHHFIEGDEDGSEYLVDTDKIFNYYVCSGYCLPGERVLAYGIWDGEKLISHPGYIFLESEPVVPPKSLDEIINSKTEVSSSGLLLFTDWKETREDKEAKMKILQDEVAVHQKHQQNKGEVYERQKELRRLSKELNTWYETGYVVAGCNPAPVDGNGVPVKVGDTVYVESMVAQTKIEFMGKEYRVAPSDDISALKVNS